MILYSTEVTKYNHDKPEWLDRFDELIINENGDGTVFDFMKRFSERHDYVIRLDDIQEFLDNNTINSYDSFTKENPEIMIKFSFYHDTPYSKQLRDLMKQYDFPFFYEDYIRSWDTLNGFVAEGVSDVYIVEEMCFDLPKVRDVVGQNIDIRVIPHIAQSSYLDMPAMLKFFIRPDDIPVYQKYVNVFELKNIQNPNAAVTLAKIYQDQGWAGQLSEIISDFDLTIDNRDILPLFAETRMACDKRCMKGSGCNMCRTYESVAQKIKDKGLLIDKYHEFTNSN